MAERYLKALKGGKVVAVGDDKSVTITGEPANTKIVKGAYKVAFDKTVDKSLSGIASELVDVPEFTTLPISVTGVNLDKTALALDTGKTGTLSATVSPSNATNKAVSWSSDTTTVATVDNTGKVTAVKAGTAKITVKTTDGSKTAVCTVTVKDPTVSVTGVTLDKTTLSLEEGATGQLKATVAPTNATNKAVSWSSDTTAVATVDSNGKVTAVKAGTAKITVKTADGAKTAVCTVTVKDPIVSVTGVTLDKNTLSLEEGATGQLTATVAPSNATNKAVTFSSSAAETATVDNNGKVTAIKAGKANITVKTADGAKTAVCALTVTAPAEG